MTSAAAIDLLDNLIGMVDDNQGNDYDAALHMAIDVLKAQENKQLRQQLAKGRQRF